MPFERPTLSALRSQVAQDIATAIPGADALLRFANLRVLGDVQAGLAHLHYGYLDYIAQQAVPFTATGEFLEAWAALKGLTRTPAARASGQVTFTGATVGAVIPSGSELVRGDGVTYTSTADATVGGGGTAVVSAIADADPDGLLGARGNADVGTVFTLSQAIAGVPSSGAATTAFTGGADLETDDSLRSRMLQAYQSAPSLGDEDDYESWALAVAGVTRAWVTRNGMGTGTVVVYVMLDEAESAHAGFPQGTDGVATSETRATAATGDQLAVANYIWTQQPVTALVYVVSPVAHAINITINGIASASAATKAAIAAAVADVFYRVGAPGQTVNLSDIEAAIAAVPDTAGFVITTPSGNVTQTAGQLPIVGTITYT